MATARSLLRVIVFLLLIVVAAVAARAAEPATVKLTLVNAGVAPVELLWLAAEQTPTPLDVVIDAGFERDLEAAPGTVILVRATTGDGSAGPFLRLEVGSEPPGEPIVLADPRSLRPVELTIVNPLAAAAALSLPSSDDPPARVELDTFAAGDSAACEIWPGTTIVAQAADGGLSLIHEVGLDAVQRLDLATVVDPADPATKVTVRNDLTRAVVVDEVRPDAVQRLGGVAAGTAAAVDVVVGAELRILSGDGEELGRHAITAAVDQVVALAVPVPEPVVVPPVAAHDLSLLPEARRAEAAAFLDKIATAFADNPAVTRYVAYNGGDQPVWMAGLSGDALIGAKQVKPRSLAMASARVGDFSIVWPDGIAPERLKRADVVSSILVGKDMPEVADVTPGPTTSR